MHVLEKDFDAIEEANCKAIDEAVEAAEREKDCEIERLEDDNASLKGDIEKLEEENNELIAENDQLKDKEGVKELIDSLKAKVEHLTDSAIDWRRKAEALQDELNKLRQPKRRGRSRKLAA
jgi:predicted RNase H-like nuclease (RuvC/YqgF family)